MAFAPKPVPIENWFDDRVSHWGLNLSYLEKDVLAEVLSDLIADCGLASFSSARRKALGKLVLNLSYLEQLTNNKACLMVLLGNSVSTSETLQYKFYGSGGKVISGLVNQLNEAGILKIKLGYNLQNIPGANHATKLKLTDHGLQLVNQRLQIEKITVERSPVVFGGRNEPAKTPKGSVAAKSRAALINNYNELLSRTNISVGSFPLFNTELQVYRKFQDKSCKLGGRLYGGIYQNIKKELRRAIRIDGHPTVEVDIKSTHPLIAYALEGIDITSKQKGFRPIDTGVSGDPYGVSELNSNHYLARKLVKGLVTTMFNVDCDLTIKSEKEFVGRVIKSFEENDSGGIGASLIESCRKELQLNPVLDEFGYETNLLSSTSEEIDFGIATVVENILKRHHKIRHRFGSLSWRVFDYYESKILLNVIEHFTKKAVPCLTVHDSVRIGEQHEDELVEVYKGAIESALCSSKFQFHNRDRLVDVDNESCDWDSSSIEKSLLESRFLSIYADQEFH